MRLILDTNCYISFLNQRNLEQYKKMNILWESVSRLEHEVILTSHNISEIVFVLKSIYIVTQEQINKLIKDLISNPGVVYEPAYYPEIVLRIWPKNIKDYGDAVLASACQFLNAQIVTFDKDFIREIRKLNILHYSI